MPTTSAERSRCSRIRRCRAGSRTSGSTGGTSCAASSASSQGEAFSALLGRDDRPFRWNGAEPGDDPVPPVVTDGVAHPDTCLAGGHAPDRPVARRRGGSSDSPRTGTPRCSNSTRRRRCSADGRVLSHRSSPVRSRPRGARRERSDEGHEHSEPEQHRRAGRVRRDGRAAHRRRPRRRARRLDHDAAGAARSRR